MTVLLQVRGVGPAMAAEMAALGIKTISDLAKANPELLTQIKRVGPVRARMLTEAALGELPPPSPAETRTKTRVRRKTPAKPTPKPVVAVEVVAAFKDPKTLLSQPDAGSAPINHDALAETAETPDPKPKAQLSKKDAKAARKVDRVKKSKKAKVSRKKKAEKAAAKVKPSEKATSEKKANKKKSGKKEQVKKNRNGGKKAAKKFTSRKKAK